MATAGSGIRQLLSQAKVARIMLLIFMAVLGLAALVTGGIIWQEFNSYIGNLGRGFGLMVMMWLLGCLILLPTMICYFIWLHRARSNLAAMGFAGLHYSPSWTVMSYFVPVANLVVPFNTMKELHNRSHGEPEELAFTSVESATSWWSCVIASGLLTAVWFVMLSVDAVPGLHVVMPPAAHSALLLFAQLAALGAVWFLFKLVGEVTEAQNSGSFVGDTFA